MSDWPKALAKEGERFHAACRRLGVLSAARNTETVFDFARGKVWTATEIIEEMEAARAAFVQKLRRLMAKAHAERRAHDPQRLADALLSEEDV